MMTAQQRHRLDWRGISYDRAVRARRRAQHELTVLLQDMHPATPSRLPSDYGLTASEIRAERRHCLDSGWQRWEVDLVLISPLDVPLEGWAA